MEIRKLEPADAGPLEAFFHEIPEDDRTFFKEDLSDPETVRALLGETRGIRLVAVDDGGRIAGYLRVLPGTGLSRHVGEIRLVVTPSRRRSDSPTRGWSRRSSAACDSGRRWAWRPASTRTAPSSVSGRPWGSDSRR